MLSFWRDAFVAVDLEMIATLLNAFSPPLSDVAQIRVDFVLAVWDQFKAFQE